MEQGNGLWSDTMNNDQNPIKDTIENGGANAPEETTEANAAEPKPIETNEAEAKPAEVNAGEADSEEGNTVELNAGMNPDGALLQESAQPAQPEPPKKNRKGLKIGLSIIAALLVATLILSLVTNGFSGFPRGLSLPGGMSLKQFTGYNQIRNEVNHLRKQNKSNWFTDFLIGLLSGNQKLSLDGDKSSEDRSAGKGNAGAASDAKTDAASAEGQRHSETYEQVEGVSEADIIKTDGKYIYCADSGAWDGHKITIFTAQGKQSKSVATIDVSTRKTEATKDEAAFDYEAFYGYGTSIKEFYLRGDRLIALCDQFNVTLTGYTTYVQVYDISDINHITLIDSLTQSGGYESSRLIGDNLYTVTSYKPYDDRMIPVCGRGDEPAPLPAESIYSFAENVEESFLVFSALNTLDHTAQPESKSILGGVDDIYCNEDHLYLYSTVWRSGGDIWSANADSQILKVDLNEGIEFSAYTKVEGWINDRYSLDEYNGNLRVATSSYDGTKDVNNLYVLDEALEPIGALTGFAWNETIQSVRYLEDMAYVITYEETDPLFIINLSDPTSPAINGEVKITGFSTMLVPVGKDKLLGIGYHTEKETDNLLEVQEGVKLALFDISDKRNPRVLDSKSYLSCYSEVQTNPKALVYNPDRDDYVMPMNFEHWGHFDSQKMEYVFEEETYGGVLNFRIQGDKLVESAYEKTAYNAVNRCVYVGNDIYMTYYENDELKLDSIPYR